MNGFLPIAQTLKDQALRAELLASYSEKPARRYLQIDGFLVDAADVDFVMNPDGKGGDCIMTSVTDELRKHGPDLAVRVQIHEDTSHDDACRLLRKALECLERDDLSSWRVLQGNAGARISRATDA